MNIFEYLYKIRTKGVVCNLVGVSIYEGSITPNCVTVKVKWFPFDFNPEGKSFIFAQQNHDKSIYSPIVDD